MTTEENGPRDTTEQRNYIFSVRMKIFAIIENDGGKKRSNEMERIKKEKTAFRMDSKTAV